MGPSPPQSRWEDQVCDKQSGEKRREDERGECITERAEQRLLPLPDLAEPSGLLDNGGTSLPTACLVGAQGGHWLALLCQAPGKDEGIFQGLTRPLPEVGSGGMSGIAQQGHPATSPVTHGSAIEEIVAQDGLLVGGLDQAPDGLPPASKEAQEVCLAFPLPVLFADRAVERGVPEHPPVANRQHATAPTSPPRLAGNAWGDVLLLEEGDSPTTGLAAVARGCLAQ